MAVQALQVGEGGFGREEAPLGDLGSGVINEGYQGARRAAALEPVVGATIDLHPFSKARAWGAIDALAPVCGFRPCHSPAPNIHWRKVSTLNAPLLAMVLVQFLMREGGAKVSVVLANQRQRPPPQPIR